MKSDTAEQEQKGVRMPRHAANTSPTPSRLSESRARVFSAEKKFRTTPMAKTMSTSSSITLGTS